MIPAPYIKNVNIKTTNTAKTKNGIKFVMKLLTEVACSVIIDSVSAIILFKLELSVKYFDFCNNANINDHKNMIKIIGAK